MAGCTILAAHGGPPLRCRRVGGHGGAAAAVLLLHRAAAGGAQIGLGDKRVNGGGLEGGRVGLTINT